MKLPRNPWFALAASLLVCIAVWRWAETILIPSNTRAAQAKKIPIGNNSDLYPRWLGARELLLHHRDPYSPEITSAIQTGFYGRHLDPSNPADPKDQVAFTYPLYVVFFIAPIANLPFPIALGIVRWLLMLSFAAGVPLWMSALRFHKPGTPRGSEVVWAAAASLLALGTLPAVMEFHMQNLAALVIFFLAAAAAAALHNWLALSGFLLALATIKPDISSLMIFWFVLWAASRWRERQQLLWSFLATMAALVIGSEMLVPHWIRKFLTAVRYYPKYAGDPSILQLFLPSAVAKITAVVLLGVLVALCWSWRKAPAGSERFGWAVAWVASVTLAVLPKQAAYNQPLLIPALLILLAHRETILKAGLLPRAMSKAVLMCLLWQWGTAVFLAICSVLIPSSNLQAAAGVPEYTLLALPPITLLAVCASVGAGVHARAVSP